MVNAKHRNMVRTAQSNIYRHGNMHQNQQQRVQTTQLYDSAAKIQKPIPSETGTQLKYAIKELRLHPEKLTHAYQEQQKKENKTATEHDWGECADYQKRSGNYWSRHIHSKNKKQQRRNQH